MGDLVSRPFNPDPEKCCLACIFGSGVHADFCPLRPRMIGDAEYTFTEAQLDKWVGQWVEP